MPYFLRKKQNSFSFFNTFYCLKFLWRKTVLQIVWKYKVWNTQFQIWDAYDKNSWFYKRANLSYFTFKNENRIARPKHHVSSTRDVSLCVSDSSTSCSIISLSELLDKLSRLFHSESLDIFFTPEFLLNSKVWTNLNTHNDVTTP